MKAVQQREGDTSGIVLQSVLTCPLCGQAKEETMPTDACQWFYECPGCKSVLRPRAGDCCVFCSYGTHKCPSIQAGTSACCSPPIFDALK